MTPEGHSALVVELKHLKTVERPAAEGDYVQPGISTVRLHDDTSHPTLWRTDGTPAGTVLALDPAPSSASRSGESPPTAHH